MSLNYSLALSPCVNMNDPRFVNEAVNYVISCDLKEMTDELKACVDSLYQDLLMCFHLSAEHSILEYMSSVENLARKFEESVLSSNSPIIAYYWGKLEGLRSLYRLGQQQRIMNKYTGRKELMNLFVRMLTTGDCDLDSLLKIITENDIEMLNQTKLINVKDGGYRRVTLSRSGRYCLIKRFQDSQGITLKLYAVVQSIPDVPKLNSVPSSIGNSIMGLYSSKKQLGGAYGLHSK